MEQRSMRGHGKSERTSKEYFITGMNRKSDEIIHHCTEQELKSAKKSQIKCLSVRVKRYHKEAFNLPFSLRNVEYHSCKLVELKQALYILDTVCLRIIFTYLKKKPSYKYTCNISRHAIHCRLFIFMTAEEICENIKSFHSSVGWFFFPPPTLATPGILIVSSCMTS